jgi:copper chaperone NosL
MGLAQAGHGAQALLTTGRAYVFDSVECLAGWLVESPTETPIHSLWVIDFSDPGTLIRAEEAFFLASSALKSPMGLGLTAFARAADRDGAANAFGGDALTWSEVQTRVAEAWPDGRPAHRGHMESEQATPAPAHAGSAGS